jgi:hypothetical protein
MEGKVFHGGLMRLIDTMGQGIGWLSRLFCLIVALEMVGVSTRRLLNKRVWKTNNTVLEYINNSLSILVRFFLSNFFFFT